jgi:hypothetical protein
MNNGKLVTRADYAHILIAAGVKIENINFSSDEYWCPSKDWLIDFGKWVKWDRPDYTEGVFVCFQFARMAAAEADRSALRAKLQNHHSFGEALVNDNNTSHEINLCLCDDKVLYAFDPQCCEDTSTIVPVGMSEYRPVKFRV